MQANHVFRCRLQIYPNALTPLFPGREPWTFTSCPWTATWTSLTLDREHGHDEHKGPRPRAWIWICVCTQIKMNGSGRCASAWTEGWTRSLGYAGMRVDSTYTHVQRWTREWRVENSGCSLKREQTPLKTQPVTGSDSIYIMEKARDNVCTALFDRGCFPIFPSPAATVQAKSLLMGSFGFDHRLTIPSLDFILSRSALVYLLSLLDRPIPNFWVFTFLSKMCLKQRKFVRIGTLN